jgi:hypothetical protein
MFIVNLQNFDLKSILSFGFQMTDAAKHRLAAALGKSSGGEFGGSARDLTFIAQPGWRSTWNAATAWENT